MSEHELPTPDGIVPALRAPAGLPAGRDIELGVGEEPPRELREYLRIVWKHRRLAAQCFGGTMALAVAVTLLTPRRYTAATRLQVARQSPIQLRLADNVRPVAEDTDPTASATFLSTQVATLQSRDLAARVLGRPDLMASGAFTGAAGSGQVALAALVPDGLRPRFAAPADPPGPPPDAADAAVADPKLLDRYAKYLAVSEVRGTDLIEVSFTTPSPALSAFLAAAHTQAYIEASDEARHATDSVAETFLDRQVADARAEMERAEAALAAFAAAHPNVAVNEEQKLVAGRITELASLLTKAEGTRATLESRYDFLTDPKSDRLAYFLNEPAVEKLRLALLDVRAQIAGLEPRLGPNHPQMEQLRELESALAHQLDGEVQSGMSNVRSHYAAAKLREQSLRTKLAHEEETGTGLRTLGAQYDLLRRDVETARTLHTSLLKQRLDTRVNAALVPPNVRVIERAEVPHRASRPKIPLNLALGAFSGVVLALGAVFGREYLDASVKSSDAAEELLQLPTLAAIPNFALARRANGAATNGNGTAHGADAGDELLVLHEPWSRVAEAFRSMRTLLFSTAGAPPRLILVTSARPAEGKTVASLNLASTLAELGGRTLLVDADLRHPRCHAALGIANQQGLAGVLAGHERLDDAIQPLDVPNFFFLPAGAPPKNPAELVAGARMRELLALLRDRFDHIVLDTPPVLPVTDATILARHADGVVLVVKGHETPADAVRRARDRLGLVGARFLGVLMNDVGLGWGDPYFYDTYYSYGGPRSA